MMKKFLAVLCVVLMSLFAAACKQEKAVMPEGDALTESKAREYTVTLYRLPEDGTEKLYAEQAKVSGSRDELPQLALEALVNTQPQDKKMINAFPKGLKILSLKVDKGVAVVDFSREIYNIEAGSYSEFMLTSAITNTLTEFSEIKEVRFLIEGEKKGSIKGHIDLLDAFERNTDLIAK